MTHPSEAAGLCLSCFSGPTGALRVAWLPFLTERRVVFMVIVGFILFFLSSICVSPHRDIGYL